MLTLSYERSLGERGVFFINNFETLSACCMTFQQHDLSLDLRAVLAFL